MTQIVPPKTLIEVLTRSHVAAARLRAAHYINVKHRGESIHRAGGIRTHDLLNPIQAFYQAELRPEVVEEDCLFVENREKQFPDDFRSDLSPRRPFYQAELRPDLSLKHG